MQLDSDSGSQRTTVANAAKDGICELDEAVKKHQVNWHWVKGHSGHPENERCDDLARNAAEANPTKPDEGFVGN